MAHRQRVCPECQEPLEGSFCKNTLCDIKGDIRDAFFDKSMIDPLSVLTGLAGTGRVYYDTVSESLVLRGSLDAPVETIRLAGTSPLEVERFAEHVCYWLKFTPKQYGTTHAKRTLMYASKIGYTPLPVVEWSGRFPLLQLNPENDQLYFPTITSDLGRYMGRFLYLGRALTPTDHNGLFEKWLASFRCATKVDVDVLRGWCVGAMLQALLPSGSVPGLLVVAHDNGAGKTATGEMLAAIFGDALSVFWASEKDYEGFMRKLLGGRNRIVLIDNLVPEGTTRAIHSSTLASQITREKLTVKRMYVTAGSNICENKFLYILTANAPQMSPELLSRVLVLSLDKQVTSSVNWIKDWKEQRWNILEDLMHYCIGQWSKGVRPTVDETFRFPAWNAAVARVLGTMPALRGTRPAIDSCYGWVVAEILRGAARSELPVKVLLELLQISRSAATAALLQQQRMTVDLLILELSMSSKIEVFEKEGVPWAKLT